MVIAGLVVGEAFTWLGLTPNGRHAKVETLSAAVSWNATTFLDIAALLVSAVLVWRFFATGGGPMLRMMDEPMDEHAHHDHHQHAHHSH
jgi:hypothetical protein